MVYCFRGYWGQLLSPSTQQSDKTHPVNSYHTTMLCKHWNKPTFLTDCFASPQGALVTVKSEKCDDTNERKSEFNNFIWKLDSSREHSLKEIRVGSDRQIENRMEEKYGLDIWPDPLKTMCMYLIALKRDRENKHTKWREPFIQRKCSNTIYCTVEDGLSVRNSHE